MNRHTAVLAGAATLALSLASCSSSSTTATTTTATKTTTTAFGHDDQGTNTPAAAGSVAVAALSSGHPMAVCSVADPTQYAKCVSTVSPTTGQVTATNVRITQVVVHGAKGLVGLTGTICTVHQGASTCTSNTNATQISTSSSTSGTGFDANSGSNFDTLYAQATNPSVPSSSFIVPLVNVGGLWYVTGF